MTWIEGQERAEGTDPPSIACWSYDRVHVFYDERDARELHGERSEPGIARDNGLDGSHAGETGTLHLDLFFRHDLGRCLGPHSAQGSQEVGELGKWNGNNFLAGVKIRELFHDAAHPPPIFEFSNAQFWKHAWTPARYQTPHTGQY